MRVSVSKIVLNGTLLGPQNPLPVFMSKNRSLNLKDDGLLPHEKAGFDYETGKRVLPYLMQDNYDRNKQPVELKTIILENDFLRATFLPEYGARLYSLYSKKHNKELLYVNPVFQPANLAIRNAWFSGGIEWNIGHFGHTFLTMEDYFGVVCPEIGNDGEFLRFYEYERCKRVFLQMDFHLYPNSECLVSHNKIINPKNESVPMYWWTNIAVPESDNVRIFSGSSEVIYMQPVSAAKGAINYFTHGTMPFLSSLSGLDASYPENFIYSNEYFFQNLKKYESAWEAACYSDGSVFFERSTPELAYRKMFCWGTHKGGKRWKEFLSGKDTGNYVEIQAGLARTQVHGFDLEPFGTISFTQIFGKIYEASSKFDGEWNNAATSVFKTIDSKMPGNVLKEIDLECNKTSTVKSGAFVHFGSGWGALEATLNPGSIPQHLIFPESTIGEEQRQWLQIVRDGVFTINGIPWPASFMTDLIWIDLLLKCKKSTPKDHSMALTLAAVGLWENGRYDEAIDTLSSALTFEETAFAFRCMAMLLHADGRNSEAMVYMEKAVKTMDGKIPHIAFARDFVFLATENEEHEKAWNFFENLAPEYKDDERIILTIAPSALKLDKRDFLREQFDKEFAVLREGENGFVEIYKEITTRIFEDETGIAFDDAARENFKNALKIPENLDFRMS